ncbi:signal peptidase II [Streptomyces antioxidans]|nr:signal peptidase II [Streptomyces antioxidans]
MKPRPATGRLLFPLAALAVILADQLSKAMALAAWSGTVGPQARFGPFCALLVRNTGVAFGLGQSRPALIVVITLAGAVATLGAAGVGLRVRGRGAALGLGLIAGGATGNGADRMIRSPGPLRGAVIDWITLDARGPVFNLADVALLTGTLLTAALLLRRTSRAAERDVALPAPGAGAPDTSAPGTAPDPVALSLPPCAPRPDRRPDPPPPPSREPSPSARPRSAPSPSAPSRSAPSPSPGSAPAAPPPPPPAPGSPAPRGTPRSP